jgi:hypothetical protein
VCYVTLSWKGLPGINAIVTTFNFLHDLLMDTISLSVFVPGKLF